MMNRYEYQYQHWTLVVVLCRFLYRTGTIPVVTFAEHAISRQPQRTQICNFSDGATVIVMSLSEYSQIMKEAGLGSGCDKIKVEHIFIVDVSERWERLLKEIVLGTLEIGQSVADSMRIVALAVSTGIILWGSGQLVTSVRRKSLGNENE